MPEITWFVAWALLVVGCGLSGFGVARTVRTFQWVQPFLHRGVKPFACNLCMGFWGTLVGTLMLLAVACAIQPFTAWKDTGLPPAVALEAFGAEVLRWLPFVPLVWWPGAAIPVMLLDRYSGIVAEAPLPEMAGMPGPAQVQAMPTMEG